MAEKVFDGEIQIKNKVDKNPILDMYKRMMDYNKGMERSLSNQVMYSKMLRNNLKGLGNIKLPKAPTNLPSTPQQPTAPTTPTKDKPIVPEYVGEMGPQLPKSIAKERRKEEREITKENQRQLALEEEKTKVLKRNRLFLQKELTTEEQITKEAIAQQIAVAKSKKQVKDIVSDEMAILNAKKRQTTQLRKQSFLMKRMQASSQQFAGNMVSAFAVAAGVTGVVKTGQEFEAINNTLMAVSGSSEQAGKDFNFVKEEAFRLGLGLKESAKGFAKMKAAQGELADQDIETIFKGISEASTVLQLSNEQQSRSLNALVQMLSKGKISAEELRLQLGETMPTAIRDMAKAAQNVGLIDKALGINDATAEMLRLQSEGKLITSEILPEFGRVLSSSFKEGLDGALKSNKNAMNRLITSWEFASDTMFKAGFGEGLTEFFDELGKLIQENEVLWKSLGKVIGSVLKGITGLIKIANPLLQRFGNLLDSLTAIFGDFSGVLLAAVAPLSPFFFMFKKLNEIFPKTGAGLAKMGKSIGGVAGKFMLWAAAMDTIIVVLEELVNAFITKDKIGLLYDPRNPDASMEERLFGFKGAKGMGSVMEEAARAANAVPDIGVHSPYRHEMGVVPGGVPEITLQGDIYLNQDKVGDAVFGSSTGQDAIIRAVATGLVSDY